MASVLGATHDVQVDAPDGPAALELEHRLYALRPTAVLRRGGWVVDLPGVHSVEFVEAAVKEWLRLIGADGTTMHVDGSPHTVLPERRDRHKPSHADFIG